MFGIYLKTVFQRKEGIGQLVNEKFDEKMVLQFDLFTSLFSFIKICKYVIQFVYYWRETGCWEILFVEDSAHLLFYLIIIIINSLGV